jgi:uncharacterized protein YegP (UPF0339 family)
MYFTIYVDVNHQWRWRLRAANHRVIADSAESYYNKTDCLSAISLVKSAHSAPVYEH